MTSNEKNFELQNCKSRQKLQFSYKVYFRQSKCKKVTFFWKKSENWDLDMKTEIWIIYRLFDYEDGFKW
jgi:hypothetical protein